MKVRWEVANLLKKQNKTKQKTQKFPWLWSLQHFLDLTPKAMGAKRKMNIQTYIKLKCSEKQR